MHTSKYEHTTFIHNSDLSGEVIIQTKIDKNRKTEINGLHEVKELKVSGADLEEFMFEHFKSILIAKLEQLSAEEVKQWFQR